MIFAKTLPLVLSGRKRQTLRLAYAGDYLVFDGMLVPSSNEVDAKVCDRDGRPRWIVGHTYAVQPERCHAAQGRILCTSLREVLNPLDVDDKFARAEGFDTRDDFFRVWKELHRKEPVQRCWAIGFVLAPARVDGGDDEGVRP